MPRSAFCRCRCSYGIWCQKRDLTSPRDMPQMEEQLLNEAIEKCQDDSTSMDELFEVLSLAALIVA